MQRRSLTRSGGPSQPRKPMTDPMKTDRLKDLTRSAALLVDAAENAPRALDHVETAFGDALVASDDGALDIDLNGRDASVHVRFEGGG